MGKEKDNGQTDQEPKQREPQQAQAQGSDDFDARLDSALDRLVKSGRLVGGGGAEADDSGSRQRGEPSSSPAPTLDVDGAVERAFKRREEAQQEDTWRKSVDEKLAKQGERRRARWFEPWRP